MNDPDFRIDFYSMETLKAVEVNLDSVNHIPASLLSESLRKKGSSFRLPLSPHSDTAVFQLAFTRYPKDTADTGRYKKDLVVIYRRHIEEATGAVKIIADQFKVYDHNFDSLAPANFDPLKTSNEAIIKAYF